MRSNGIRVVSRRAVMLDFACVRARFVDEGEKLCKLKQWPFVVRAFEVKDGNSTSYIVFENVIGTTLQRRLANGAPAEVDRLLARLLECRQHVHEAGLLHGDVRPANIVLTGSNTPRLIDFGGTRALMQSRYPPLTPLPTSAYDPPEKITGKERSAASDIYRLAAKLPHHQRRAAAGRRRLAEGRSLPATRRTRLAGLRSWPAVDGRRKLSSLQLVLGRAEWTSTRMPA